MRAEGVGERVYWGAVLGELYLGGLYWEDG